MKHIILSVLCVLYVASAYSQRPVADFVSAMTSAPVGKKISITDVIYAGGGGIFESVEMRSIKSPKPSKSTRVRYETIGQIIDSLGLIDYKADTLFILTDFYTPSSSISESFKGRSQTEPFRIDRDESGEYIVKRIENLYDNNTDPRVIVSDSLFYDTIFSWDIDKLIRMIKVSGGYEGGENFMSATRIILQNNRVIAKEIVNFKPTLLWRE